MNLCNLCNGRQNLFNMQQGTREWFVCPGCQGKGVRGIIGPKTIMIKPFQGNLTEAGKKFICKEI